MNLNRFVRSAYGIVRNKYDLYWDEKKNNKYYIII